MEAGRRGDITCPNRFERKKTVVPWHALLPLFLAGLVFPGCGRHGSPAKEEAMLHETAAGPFRPYDSTRVIVDSIRMDLNRDGKSEFVVTSYDATMPWDPLLPARFDRLEIFTLDPRRGGFRSAFVDPVENGASVSVEDVTKNGMLEIVVRTDAGGNDPIASTGLAVYGCRSDGSFTVLFVSTEGAPEIKDIDGDARPEILVTGQYWGVTPHADVLVFTAEIHRFDGEKFVEDNRAYAAYFDAEISRARAEYERLKSAKVQRDAEASERLYRAFASLALWVVAKGDLYGLRTLWNNERQMLAARLSQDQFDDLDGLVQDVLGMQQQVRVGPPRRRAFG
ncbi:MAG: hypothetical protein QHI48_04880 [Bacteroidota bacterium]|nr:hypothetical protein [Bacteroidota bacterium]